MSFAQTMRILQEGNNILGTYEVERFLGEGAFAEVYRVRHRFLGRQAMKVFKRPGLSINETEEILGEAIILSRIGHPNIIRVFDANVFECDDGFHGFFTMEYVAGGTLDRFWRSFGEQFIPVEQTVDLVQQVCQGLAVAHSENPPMIHRDIKPQNILVGYDPTGVRVRVSDFGLAKKVNPMTLIASAQGTLTFKAPEFLNCQDSTSTDVWALGSTLYLLLTDQLPYPNFSEEDLISGKRWQTPIPSPIRFNIDVDPELESITMRALAINPEDRYQNAKDMLADLKNWRKGPTSKKGYPSTTTKTKSALGRRTPPDAAQTKMVIEKAIALSQHPDKLIEAADLLEEAVNADPTLRKEYEYQIQLWRKGISM